MREQARFESFVVASSRAQSVHTHHTQLHMLGTQPQLSKQTMNAMKLENVVPLPLEFNEYAEATLDVLGGRSPHDSNQALEVQDCSIYSISFCCSFEVFQIYNTLLVEVE